MKTVKQKIMEVNQSSDAREILKLVEFLLAGRLKTRDGVPVIFSYNDLRDLFKACDPSIDADRFEEMMAAADDLSNLGIRPPRFSPK